MTTRRYDLDAAEDSARFLADQTAAARHDADRFDRTAYVRVAGQWMEADRAPDPSDVADLNEWGPR